MRSARDTAAALKSATGMLRTEVGKNITARLTPSLEFILDAIPENAEHIDALLREARERDAEVAGLAASAEYAGDDDPYVKPREFDEDEEEADAEGLARDRGLTQCGSRARPSISSMSPSSASEVIARSRCSASGQCAISWSDRMPGASASRSAFSTAPRAWRSLPS